MSMKKWLVGAMACSSLLLASCANDEGEEVASTEAGKIRENELYERMKNEPTQGGLTYGQQMLQQMLLEDILENEFEDDVTDEQVNAEFEEEAEQYGGVDAFEEMLAQQGLSAEDVKENIRTSLYVEEAIIQNTDMTEEEVQKAYDEYVVDATVAHILVEEEDLARDIIDQLNDGADFSELVTEYSTDTGTIDAGGELPLEPGRFVPEFEEAAVKLEEGEITQEPVKSEFGYHIIKMVEKGEKGTLEEERETIEDMIIEGYMQDQEIVQESISQVVQNANVQIADDELAGAMQQFLPTPEVEETDGEDSETDGDSDTESSEEDSESAE
ncbi:peptidylprolyl isomerase [Alkalibacterium kapii]|uniref:Foldase protein PrsA n=1 Tax=Alkalibacterium kapii TaxID=426704 RepID=A0A511AVU3_9LACT|nr:peptidylprolyl isomerase [Alkalibacterium kapii]GEK91453.1 foldase protein PrsA 2 [Alkalibacterium kapii]